MRNPGKIFSIYEVAGCDMEAHMKAMMPGIKCNFELRVFLHLTEMFLLENFAPSEVTDGQHYQNPDDML